MTNDLTRFKSLLVKNSEAFRRDYNVRRFGVFGSFARGDATEKSDLDILVELSSPIGLFKFIELEERLKVLLHRHVDLVTKNALKPAIKDDILRDTVYV